MSSLVPDTLASTEKEARFVQPTMLIDWRPLMEIRLKSGHSIILLIFLSYFTDRLACGQSLQDLRNRPGGTARIAFEESQDIFSVSVDDARSVAQLTDALRTSYVPMLLAGVLQRELNAAINT